MLADLRRALRALRARPALTLGLLLTLALGVGANAAMVGALDALLLRAPSGVRDAGGLARVYVRTRPGGDAFGAMSYPFYEAARDRARTLAGAAVVWDALDVPVGAGARAEPVAARTVSGNFFGLLGARPALGRLLGPADDREPGAAGAAPAAVLGHTYWRRAYGGDPGVLGRTLTVGPLLGGALGAVGAGLGAGAVLALAGGPATRALLYGVAPTDPRPLGLAAHALAGTAVAAALLAARRGVAVPPTEALRSE